MPRIIRFPREWYDFSRCTFSLQSLNISSQSPWTGRRSVSAGPQIFKASLTMAVQEWSDWMAIEGMFAELAGSYGLLRFADPARLMPQWNRELIEENGYTVSNWSDGSTFTDGSGWINDLLPSFVTLDEDAERGDTSVVLKGLPPSESNVLRRGDDIEFRVNNTPDQYPRLHRMVRTTPTNSAGKARVEFRPPLRAGLAEGDTAVLQYPESVFRLASDDQGIVERTPPLLGNLAFDLVEAIV